LSDKAVLFFLLKAQPHGDGRAARQSTPGIQNRGHSLAQPMVSRFTNYQRHATRSLRRQQG
jgi:hypothetical protein